MACQHVCLHVCHVLLWSLRGLQRPAMAQKLKLRLVGVCLTLLDPRCGLPLSTSQAQFLSSQKTSAGLVLKFGQFTDSPG